MSTGSDDEYLSAFASRLRELVAVSRRPDGSSWTIPAVAEALTERGYRVSRQHLFTLARGQFNPSWGLVVALADLFETSTDSFTAREQAERELPVALYRAGELPPEQLASVVDYIGYLNARRKVNG